MSYTVVWEPAAERKLAEIWLASSHRAAITAAADDIERMLRHDPTQAGELVDVDKHRLISAPLVVYFDVSVPDRRVHIWAVWAVRE